MSARLEADSQMLSSPDDSDTEVEPTHLPSSSSAVLSPPSSQHRGGGTGGGDDPSSPNMPTTASGATLANSNGKRPIQTISNGNDDAEEVATMANDKARQDFPPKTHKPSGYTWDKVENEPGYAWSNKKAVDEYQRAWDALTHKELMVQNRYGDPFEAVEREQAILASLQQR